MIQAIKNLFGVGTKADYSELVKQGAIILDVRSKAEFTGGHIKNSINIPVDQLSNNLSKLKNKDKCIICCCASGMRSGTAKRILESQGYTAVFNGGSWNGLQNKL
ncbi:MAG TPA: rhodanese-like domain-containing protein [Hanamia sp.]|nr:rhodanese-like domain-containing protein [Hanamia sp.]